MALDGKDKSDKQKFDKHSSDSEQGQDSSHDDNSPRDSTDKSEGKQSPKTEGRKSSAEHDKKDENSRHGGAEKPKSAAEKKYGYRLTPEEQELAYELKASMMRKLEKQNTHLEAELAAQKNMTSLRRKQQQRPYSCRLATGSGISQHNMKLLMKSYEKKAKDAEEKINQLEQELKESRDLSKRYHDMYISEKEKSGKSHSSNKSSSDSSPKSSPGRSDASGEENKTDMKESDKKKSPQVGSRPPSRAKSARDRSSDTKEGKDDKVTEEDLEDDEAVYKRHIARIAETKSMRTTSPIRIQDVIRKNEVLIQENETLKREVSRLKWDNGQLVKKVKLSSTDKDKLLHMVNTSDIARRDLNKRLEKETTKNNKLSRSLSRQATDWVQFRKDLQESENQRKMAMLIPMSTGDVDAQERTFRHSPKRNVYMPRYMYPVEQYSNNPNS